MTHHPLARRLPVGIAALAVGALALTGCETMSKREQGTAQGAAIEIGRAHV